MSQILHQEAYLRDTPSGTLSWTLPIVPKCQGTSVAICLSRFKNVSRKLVENKNLFFFQKCDTMQ